MLYPGVCPLMPQDFFLSNLKNDKNMKKTKILPRGLGKLRYILIFTLFCLFLINTLFTTQDETKKNPKSEEGLVIKVGKKQLDPRAQILKSYLEQYNSPLQYHAQDFIDAADQYKMDWRLVPAISGVESTFGKAIPGGFNGWGWGVYGNQALAFGSWKDGIFTVSKGLRENYINRGLTEPYSMNKIYAASSTWGVRVAYFIDDIQKQTRPQPVQPKALLITNFPAQTAGHSAQLSFNIAKLAFLN